MNGGPIIHRYWRLQLEKKQSRWREQVEEMRQAQQGLCRICQVLMTTVGRTKMCIDHCHQTGKVRGRLCQPCNVAMGQVDKHPAWCQQAQAYLAL
jgi:hypothetical protein